MIMGKGKPKGEPLPAEKDDAEGDESASDAGIKAAAADMLTAIKDNDADALAAAVKAAVTCCGEED
jgi:hypothetical protein